MSKIICNPMDLEYRYQIKTGQMGEGVYREAADPTVVVFQGVYLLFASMSGGFWHSRDLARWHFHETPELPIYDYAPDVRIINGRVVFSASRRGVPCSFYASPDPMHVPFQSVSTVFDFWDPDIFQDDDGRVYFYWGCTNKEPIWGMEMDPVTLQPTGEKRAMFGEQEAKHGWERKGENNKLDAPLSERDRLIREHVGTKPFIEGAFMTKYQNRYYLQYAAPGTECNVYGDGVYVGESPLGPFIYQNHNPFSSKPGGFITSAGHGSTFQDLYGNWWHISTMRISVNENFERRIGLFPCAFDKDGVMHCKQDFADYPFAIPDGVRIDAAAPAMQLLSCNKTATASTSQPGHGPKLGVDENIRTWWAAEQAGDNQWYQLDLGRSYPVEAVQINFADHQIPAPAMDTSEMHHEHFAYRWIQVRPQSTEYALYGSVDGDNWKTLEDTRGMGSDLAHHLLMFDTPETCRYLRLSHMKLPFGAVPAVSGLRVFGHGGGKAPVPVKEVSASRENRLNILLHWARVEGADGYNVRYGTAPDKLYNSWQVQGKNELDLSTVDAEYGYYVAVDSFNENGVTTGTVVYIQ